MLVTTYDDSDHQSGDRTRVWCESCIKASQDSIRNAKRRTNPESLASGCPSMSTYRSISRLYACEFCIEPLVEHPYSWFQLPMALILCRPFRCVHCNLIHVRPLRLSSKSLAPTDTQPKKRRRKRRTPLVTRRHAEAGCDQATAVRSR